MSLSDLYDSEFKSRNKGHFSAIVRVAIADGDLSPEEKIFLDKLALQLEISPEEYDAFMKTCRKIYENLMKPEQNEKLEEEREG